MSIKKVINTPLSDDNFDEFDSTWDIENDNKKDDINIEKSIKSVLIDKTEEISNSLPSNSPKKTALEVLIQSRSIELVNSESKKIELLEQGKIMIEEYKERGISVHGINETMIIKEWFDSLYLDINSNLTYLNNLVESVLEYGYESPRPIQCVTVGRIAKGGDLIVQAKAGNGKTAAFVFGSSLRIDPTMLKTQVLILSPTGILTDQTMNVVINLTNKTGIIVHCYRGGLQQPTDKKVPHIVVGCPGRIVDLIKRKRINLISLKTIILDEGDELLKQGFREQVKFIIENLADTVQICLFSATLPTGILELCNGFMREPAYVILPDNQVITELVTQWYIKCSTLEEKDGSLVDIIEKNTKDTIIVFFNSCSRLQKVSQTLTDYKKTKHLCIHGKMESIDRTKSLNEFTNGKCKILLASDMAARGLDIPIVTLVVNYDIPCQVETYVHRIGRSGRGDKLGNSITLIMTDDDKQKMSFIIQVHGIPIRVLKSIKMETK